MRIHLVLSYSTVESYFNKHLKRCLAKKERDIRFREHSRPNLDSCVPPKVYKYFANSWRKVSQGIMIWSLRRSVLAGIRPLTSTWDNLLGLEADEDSDMVLPESVCVVTDTMYHLPLLAMLLH